MWDRRCASKRAMMAPRAHGDLHHGLAEEFRALYGDQLTHRRQAGYCDPARKPYPARCAQALHPAGPDPQAAQARQRSRRDPRRGASARARAKPSARRRSPGLNPELLMIGAAHARTSGTPAHLMAEGQIAVTQKGNPVDPLTREGPDPAGLPDERIHQHGRHPGPIRPSIPKLGPRVAA